MLQRYSDTEEDFLLEVRRQRQTLEPKRSEEDRRKKEEVKEVEQYG